MAHPEMIRRRSPRPARLPGRLLAALGLVALLGGMAVVVLASREGSTEQTAAPTTTRAAPAETEVEAQAGGAGQDRRHRSRSLRSGRRPLRERQRRRTRHRRDRLDGLEDRALPQYLPQGRRRARPRRGQAGSGSAGRRHDRDPGLQRAGPGRRLAERALRRGLALEDDHPRTVFALKPRRGRYLVLWITSMPADGVAAVNEVAVTARG